MIPLMKRVLIVALVIRFVDVVRTYDAVYVLTRGGPASSTDVYSMYLFRVGFEFFRVDLAAALSLIYLVLVSRHGVLGLLAHSSLQDRFLMSRAQMAHPIAG